MSSPRFSRYLLRTTDVEAATAFYGAVLERSGDGIVLLHESAIARGARPHWPGHVGVRAATLAVVGMPPLTGPMSWIEVKSCAAMKQRLV